MRLLRPALLLITRLLIASLPCVALAQTETDSESDNEAWVSAITAQDLKEAAVNLAMADAEEQDDSAGSEDSETAKTRRETRRERADRRVEAGKDVGVWGDLDNALPFNLLSFNIGLKLSLGQRPYKDVDTDWIIFPIIARFTDYDFTDQVLFCREGNCGLRYAKNWYEIGAQGNWNGLGYEDTDSAALAGMNDKDSSIMIGPYVGLRSDFVQLRLMYFQDVMDNSDGSETRLVFDFPIRLRTGYIVPHIDVYYQDEDYTTYYYGVTQFEADRTPGGPSAAYPSDPLSDGQVNGATNIDVAFRSQFQVGKRWFLHLNARIAFLDDSITRSPLVDSSDPNRWWFGIGFSYDIDPTQ